METGGDINITEIGDYRVDTPGIGGFGDGAHWDRIHLSDSVYILKLVAVHGPFRSTHVSGTSNNGYRRQSRRGQYVIVAVFT